MATKLKVYYHVSELPGWQTIMSDQLSKLSEKELLFAATEINICVVGNINNFKEAKETTKRFDNIKWHHISDKVELMEYATLDFLKKECDASTEEFYLLYMHQKGITRPTDRNTADWRQYLDYWSIEQWKMSIGKLDDGYDIVGTNWIDGYEPHTDANGKKVNVWPHFSGGTWWTRASYIRKLEPLIHPDKIPMGETSKLTRLEYNSVTWRYDHEAWHGAGNPKQYTLDKTPGSTQYAGWHFHNPYPRTRFDQMPNNKISAGESVKPAEFLDLRMARILVDRRKALGDVLMITPVLRELRRRYGKLAFIQVVTEETIALHNNPDVNSVVKPDQMKKEDPWDVYINLNDAYETNPLVNYIDAYVHRAFGRDPELNKNIDRSIGIHPTTQEVDKVDSIIEDQIKSDYIVVHMRRWAWENKNIDINTWGTFFTLLNDRFPNIKIVSVGAQYDYKVTGVMNGVDLVDQLSIGEIAELIGKSKCFIGGDSGPYHIASGTVAPIVALLSHLDPDQILPWRHGVFGKDVTVVQSDVPCLGCYKRQIPPVRNLKCESNVEWLCAQKFSPRAIFDAVEKYIK
jgi:ADP-heptose:LPS heptosyltransferase